jgi:hypothetical protein
MRHRTTRLKPLMRRSSSRRFPQLLLLFVLWLCLVSAASAQCLGKTGGQLRHDGRWMWRGIMEAPANAVRPRNLKWELPIVAATGVLIATGDTPASRLIQSPSLQRQAGRWSNIGLAVELGGAGSAYILGCAKNRESIRSTGQAALEAAAAASVFDGVIKRATNRQRPSRDNSSGEYWEGNSSFAPVMPPSALLSPASSRITTRIIVG